MVRRIWRCGDCAHNQENMNEANINQDQNQENNPPSPLPSFDIEQLTQLITAIVEQVLAQKQGNNPLSEPLPNQNKVNKRMSRLREEVQHLRETREGLRLPQTLVVPFLMKVLAIEIPSTSDYP